MVITQWAFIAPALLKPWPLGLDSISDRELNSLKYVIHCVGQAIGIDEDLNLCNGDLTETKMYSKLILDHIIKPNMRHPENPELSREMAENLLQGMKIMNPYLMPSASIFKTWTFNLFDINTKEMLDENNSVHLKFLENLCDKLLHGNIGSMVVKPLLGKVIWANIYLANLWEKHLLIKWRRHILTTIVAIGILIAILIVASVPILTLYLIITVYFQIDFKRGINAGFYIFVS